MIAVHSDAQQGQPAIEIKVGKFHAALVDGKWLTDAEPKRVKVAESFVMKFGEHEKKYIDKTAQGNRDAPHCVVSDQILKEFKPATGTLSKSDQDFLGFSCRRFGAFGATMARAYCNLHETLGRESALKLFAEADALLKTGGVTYTTSDARLKEIAVEFVTDINSRFSGLDDFEFLLSALNETQEQLGFVIDDDFIDSFKKRFGKDTYRGPLLSRVRCESWILSRLKKVASLRIQQAARLLRIMGKGWQPYSPEFLNQRFDYRDSITASFLETYGIYDSNGELVSTLEDAAKSNVSNPDIRVAEMYCRAKGTSELAKQLNLPAFACILTCPSRFHATTGNGKNTNPKWLKAGKPDVPASHAYLVNVFTAIRKDLDKRGIKFFGMRTSEPHADGCEHWNLLVYAAPENIEIIKTVIRNHALADSPDERGAQERRCRISDIDYTKGDGFSYFIKYITKNIGNPEQKGIADLKDKNSSKTFAQAVRSIKTWSRSSGIRMFQFFGLPSVTAWRQLRKFRAPFAADDMRLSKMDDEQKATLEGCRAAADSADWAAYVLLNGGVMQGSKRPIRPMYAPVMQDDKAKLNRYGEIASQICFGIEVNGHPLITKFQNYELKMMTQAERDALVQANVTELGLV